MILSDMVRASDCPHRLYLRRKLVPINSSQLDSADDAVDLSPALIFEQNNEVIFNLCF